MDNENALVAAKLRRWEKYLCEYKLPRWEEIPNFGLYMEQVLVLLKEYLDYLPPELKEEQFITAATINNYVRNKFMPKPVQKKYYRIHIAYLIMICSLKQSLAIGIMQRIISVDLPEEEVREVYNAYVERHRITADCFVEMVRMMAAPILEHDVQAHDMAVNNLRELAVESAVMGGLCRLLAEKLLLMDISIVDK